MSLSKGTASLIVGGFIFVVAATGYTLLSLFAPNTDARGLFTFAAIFASALGISGQVAEVADRTKTVEKNTNGVLSRHVETLAEAAAQRAVDKVNSEAQARETTAQRADRHDAEPTPEG